MFIIMIFSEKVVSVVSATLKTFDDKDLLHNGEQSEHVTYRRYRQDYGEDRSPNLHLIRRC